MYSAGVPGGLVWRTVPVAGRTTHYGSGGRGRPVIFLHGWGLTGRTYTRALEQLVSSGHRVYAPALPGFGGTPPLPDEQLSLAGYATWVDQFAHAMGIDGPVTLVGHSFGGGVAIRVARETPHLVARLVLVNSIGGSVCADGGGAAMHQRPLWDWALRLPADLLPVHQLAKVLPFIVRDAVPNLVRNPGAVWRAARIARTADLTVDLAMLTRRRLPVVIVSSDQDTVITADALGALRSALGHAVCITVPGKHAWPISDPGRFGAVLTSLPPITPTSSNAA
ncbi:MAG: alpha/beta fold hydrolase [Haloechinothrix sp.]